MVNDLFWSFLTEATPQHKHTLYSPCSMSRDEQYFLVAGRFMKSSHLIVFSSADFSVDFIWDKTELDSFRSVFLSHGVRLGAMDYYEAKRFHLEVMMMKLTH